MYVCMGGCVCMYVCMCGITKKPLFTPGGGGYSHTLPIRVCVAQRGRDFEASGLERGMHFGGVF